jgi:hypothetical protein
MMCASVCVWRSSLVVLLMSVPTFVSAQTIDEACHPHQGPFMVPSGAPFGLTFVMPLTVAANPPTDLTPVPVRVSGYQAQIDSGPWFDLLVSAVGAGDPCPAGTAFAGQMPYVARVPVGATRGNHVLVVKAWNFKLDAAGNATAERQEAVAAALPFVAADPVHTGPPPAPRNIWIRR